MKKSLCGLSLLLGSWFIGGCIAPPLPEPQQRSSEATGDRFVVVRVSDLSPVFNPELGSARFEEIFSGATPEISTEYSITRVLLPVGAKLAEHSLDASEIIYILAGGGMLNINGEGIVLEPGKAVYIPAGATQFTLNNSDKNLVFLTIISPPYDSGRERITGKPIKSTVSGDIVRAVAEGVKDDKAIVTAVPTVDKKTLMDATVPREELKKIEQNIDREISASKTISSETEKLIPRAPDTAKPVDLKNVQKLSPGEQAAPAPSQN